MTGRELIEWILENHAENLKFYVDNPDIDQYNDIYPMITIFDEDDKVLYGITDDKIVVM